MENAFTKRGHVMAMKTVLTQQMKPILQQLQNLIKSLQLILIPAFVKIGCLNALMKSAFHIGVNDCGDSTDEKGCGDSDTGTVIITTTKTPKSKNQKCALHEFRCDTGVCISRRYVYDGFADCGRGEDEENCPAKKTCSSTEFRCRSDSQCMPMEKYCDGIRHCADGSDEDCKFKGNATLISNEDCITKPGLFTCDQTCFVSYKGPITTMKLQQQKEVILEIDKIMF